MLKSFSTQFKNIGEIIAQLVRIFFIIFVVIVLIAYRDTVKEIFNYKMIYGEIIYTIKTNITKEVTAEFQAPQVNLVPTTEVTENQFSVASTAESSFVSIPKIGITTPLLFGENTNENHLQELLRRGVVMYPGSSPIESEGISIILGHSAPKGWPKIYYDHVFSELNNLRAGDKIEIFKGKTYQYVVTKKFFLNKGQEIPIVKITNSKSIVLLVSCWPPGVDKKRIVIQAELL